jgi:tetratricopeptide (TPR) repeat protein
MTGRMAYTRPRTPNVLLRVPLSPLCLRFWLPAHRTTHRPDGTAKNDIVIRDMSWTLSKLVPRSAPAVLLLLTFAAAAAFAAVSHLVTRFNANQQARARRLYTQGIADTNASRYAEAIDAFRAALVCDPANSQYQLSLARALRDSGDPRHLDEAESYLAALWQRTPEDGTINLALGRVAARRGAIDDAIRYYHNAIYGVWTSDADAYRRKARLELIDFLLQQNARGQAESELIALATFLPADPSLHFQAAQLFAQAQDYSNALSQYEDVIRLERGLDRGNAEAFAGAGAAAFHEGRYRTAQRYLHEAVTSNPEDANSRQRYDQATLILEADPFVHRISDAERNRRIEAAFTKAGDRLLACTKSKGIDLNQAPLASDTSSAPNSLPVLTSRWTAMKPDLRRMRSPAETDLPDTIMDLVFQIEQQTAVECGDPQGTDLALLLISRDRQAADQ